MSDEALKKQQFRLSRDSDGGVHLIDGVSPTLGITVKIRPLTYGESRAMTTFGKPLLEWSDKDKFYVLSNNLIEPDLGVESVDDMLNNFDAWTIEDLVQATAVYSGLARLYTSPADTEGNVEGEATEESPEG